MTTWLVDHAAELAQLVGQQALLAAAATLMGLVVAVPLGAVLAPHRALARTVILIFGSVAAIPVLVLIVAMPVFTGLRLIEPVNVVLALAVPTVSWLTRCTVVGLGTVPSAVRRSAAAAGYGPAHQLITVELPAAMPVLLSGLAGALAANLTAVALAGVIGTGALGRLFGPAGAAEQPAVLVGLVSIMVVALLGAGLIMVLRRGLVPWAVTR